MGFNEYITLMLSLSSVMLCGVILGWLVDEDVVG